MKDVIEFEGIGTHWWIQIFDKIDLDKFEDLESKIIAEVAHFENLYSRFKDTSLLSKLNIEKSLLNPPKDLVEMLKLGEETKLITDSHFNIAVGKVLEDMGYDSKYSFQNKGNNFKIGEIKFNKNSVEISEGLKIDLGGIGKGYLIDKVKAIILKSRIKYFFINAGGDIYATSNFDDPIEFLLENPFNKSEAIGKIFIKNKSIAASSPLRRSWPDSKSDKMLHHLVDMKSKQSVTEVAAVFTEGSTAVSADLASTALFVSPVDLYKSISKHFKIEFLAVFKDKSFLKSDGYDGILFS